jgi:hypothetical protein
MLRHALCIRAVIEIAQFVVFREAVIRRVNQQGLFIMPRLSELRERFVASLPEDRHDAADEYLVPDARGSLKPKQILETKFEDALLQGLAHTRDGRFAARASRMR